MTRRNLEVNRYSLELSALAPQSRYCLRGAAMVDPKDQPPVAASNQAVKVEF
jgi:hypothetical protein